MNAITIRDNAGCLLCFGPQNGMYDPIVPNNATKSIESYETVLTEWKQARASDPVIETVEENLLARVAALEAKIANLIAPLK